jgi:hypothetical protein
LAKVTSLKDFKLLKENKVSSEETLFAKDLIIGCHPIALKLLKNLSKDTVEDVYLIHEFDFKNTLHLATPRLLRGEKAYQWLTAHHPDLKIEDQNLVTKFYKDGEKREFGGRVKPHEIREEEKFFLEKSYLFNESEFYGDYEDYAFLEKKHVKAFIKKITPMKLEELASRIHFQVELTDGRKFQCENLYCTLSPSSLVPLIDKEHLSDFPQSFYVYSNNCKPLPALYVEMTLKKEWEKDLSTLFIPQSQTHEWGSFIVEFSPFDSEKNSQHLGVFCYLNEAEMADNEEVAKKIRLMKRVLDRVYSGFEKQILNEKITLSSDFYHANCEDSLFSSEKNTGSMNHFRLVHTAGPTALDAGLGSFSSLSRLLFNYFE